MSEHIIVSADWAGQELRILASESMDQVMLDAYLGEQKKDIHSVTAAGIAPTFFRQGFFRSEYDLPDEYASVSDVTYEDFVLELHSEDLGKPLTKIRKSAKETNFLMSYLGGYTTLAERLMISGRLAKEIFSATFSRYARIQPWQQEVIEEARRKGYSETAYGARRHATNDLFSSDDGLRTRMERQLVNHVIQGGAAGILKTVLSEAHHTKLFDETGALLIAPVYDELTSSVPREAAWEYCCRLKEQMEITPPGHAVPMVAEFSVSSESWGSLVEIGSSFTEEDLNAALAKTDAIRREKL
jgi:DNA polymerase I-like protein with 3'-5' exonuclease and polymerase domains